MTNFILVFLRVGFFVMAPMFLFLGVAGAWLFLVCALDSSLWQP